MVNKNRKEVIKTECGQYQLNDKATPHHRSSLLAPPVVIIAVITILLLFSVLIRLSWVAAIDQAQAANLNSARVLAIHISRLLYEIDSVMLNSAASIRSTNTHETNLAREQAKRLINHLGNIGYMIFMDSHGDLVWTTNTTNTPKTNYQDRSYFQEHLAGKDFIIGAPIIGRTTGVPIIPVSRALRDADGKFQGILLAGMLADNINTVLNVTKHRDSDAIALFRQDGLLLARLPSENIGKSYPNAKLFVEAQQTSTGNFEANSVIDGQMRLVGYATTEGFPLVITTSRIKADVLAGWWQSTFALGAITLLLITTLLLLTWRDQSRNRALQTSHDKMRRAKDEAEKANLAKSQFLASMSHELRTPLNAILGYAQLLAIDIKNPEYAGQLDVIQKSGWHLLELINQVLDLSIIEKNQNKLELHTVNLDTVLEECLSICRPLANEYAVTFQYTRTSPHFAFADPLRLKQAILNYLSNAVKYGKKSGIVTITLTTKNNTTRLSVIDAGEGIDPHNQKELFIPFNRLGREASNIRGVGLGLTITKRLIEQMNGTVGMESTPGQGSCFWLELVTAPSPLPHTENNSSTLPSHHRVNDEQAGYGTKRILYVEDDLINADFLKAVLKLHRPHLDITVASSGQQSLELIKPTKPDVLVLDINLPDIDGIELLKIYRQQGVAAPAVALTAAAMPEDIERGRIAGFHEYIVKPLDLPAFLATLDRLLNK